MYSGLTCAFVERVSRLVIQLISMETTAQKIKDLRALVSLLVSASEDVIDAWQTKDRSSAKVSLPGASSEIPSHELYNARRTILGAIGQITDLVQEPRSRCMELCTQHLETRAFHIAVEKRIPDLLKDAVGGEGVDLESLSLSTGIQAQKLGEVGLTSSSGILDNNLHVGRVLRALCSVSVFKEVRLGYFTNNNTSACLVGNENLRAWIVAMCVHRSLTNIVPLASAHHECLQELGCVCRHRFTSYCLIRPRQNALLFRCRYSLQPSVQDLTFSMGMA